MMFLIPVYALIFRARGHRGFGDACGLIAWGFFTMLELNNARHTPSAWWLLIDFVAVAILFTIGARPSWSRECWPAWQSTYPHIRNKATLASMVRAVWFVPMYIYIAVRADAGWLIFPAAIVFSTDPGGGATRAVEQLSMEQRRHKPVTGVYARTCGEGAGVWAGSSVCQDLVVYNNHYFDFWGRKIIFVPWCGA
jgi:hypothetical protein